MRRLRTSLSWNEHSVAMVAFLALFPGFFFYHTLLGLGKIGAFLGGYFAPVSILMAPPLMYFYFYRIRRDGGRMGRPEVLFALYMGYFAFIIALQSMAGANPVIITGHVLATLFITNMFFIFRLADFSRRSFRLAALASLLAMSAIVFAYSVDGAFYLAPLGTAKNPESLATYQGFSRSYLVTFVAAIAFTNSAVMRTLLYCVAAATLFVNTARSEFVALLFMIPIIEIYFSKTKVLMISVITILSLLIYLNLQEILSLLPTNRILELFDLSHSASANKRHHLSVYAMNTIANFPAFGDYGSYTPGAYSHNVLSAWVDTGLFGFVFVIALLIMPTAQMFLRGYFLPRQSAIFILSFSLACITILLLITSHYFTDMLIGATLGAYSRYRYGRKNPAHRPPVLGPSAARHPHLRETVPHAGPTRP